MWCLGWSDAWRTCLDECSCGADVVERGVKEDAVSEVLVGVEEGRRAAVVVDHERVRCRRLKAILLTD